MKRSNKSQSLVEAKKQKIASSSLIFRSQAQASLTTKKAMVREAEPSLNEKQFVLRALKDGLRTDGRRPYDFRSIQISFLSEYGHVQIQLGRTR